MNFNGDGLKNVWGRGLFVVQKNIYQALNI
jgi:hypothetical protein